MKRKHIDKEWEQLQKAEQNFLDRNVAPKTSGWQEKVAKFVPQKLENTLNGAFYKAFELIFDKGTGVIEKTYQKEKKQQNYKINEFAAEVRGSRRALRAFGREANASRTFNMAISTAEGVGMGLIGMGLPDIPIFLGVLLKSIYEVALSYGFSYDTEEEQIFILKLIETAFSHEGELAERNMELNLWMRENAVGKGETIDPPPASTAAVEEPASTAAVEEPPAATAAEEEPASTAAEEEPVATAAVEEPAVTAVEEEPAAQEKHGHPTEGACAPQPPVYRRRFDITRSEQIRRTSDALAEELLYLKFVQGLPIVGIVGGLSDMVYQKKISDYASLKYKRRFLEKLRKSNNIH